MTKASPRRPSPRGRATHSTAITLLTVVLALAGCSSTSMAHTSAPMTSAATSTMKPSAPTPAPAAAQPVADTPTPSGDVHAVDWKNATLPADCFDDMPGSVQLHAGLGTARGYTFNLGSVTYGTIGGRAVALLPTVCTGADSSDSLMAFGSAPGGVQFLGYLVTASQSLFIKDAGFEDDGVMVTTYAHSPGVPMCCPDLIETSDWQLDSTSHFRGGVIQVGPNPEASSTGQSQSQAWACQQRHADLQRISTLQAAEIELHGGSIEGVPTYSELQTFNNRDLLFTLETQVAQLNQEQLSLASTCGAG